MGLLFGSAGAHTYPKSVQVTPPPPPSLMKTRLYPYIGVSTELVSNLSVLSVKI